MQNEKTSNHIEFLYLNCIIYIFLDDSLTSWNVAFVVKNEHSKQSSNENVLANNIICITFVCSLKKNRNQGKTGILPKRRMVNI